MEVRIVITQSTTRIRKVHHARNHARIQRAMAIAKRPTYHQALRPGTIYSSACQEMSCCFFAITIL